MKFKLIVSSLAGVVVFASMYSGYSYWNMAAAEKTCANCHEISIRVSSFHASAHRELACSACHGTALSAGFHSIKEKANMIFTHMRGGVMPEDIRMGEEQVLAVSAKCARCHGSEYANWLISGHAATYKDIFLDPVHNAREAPYADCFRCHGMFYDGTIEELMEPLDQTGPWRMKDPGKSTDAAVPCLACHQVHAPNPVLAQYDPGSTNTLTRSPVFSLYSRVDKMHLRVETLPKSSFVHQGNAVVTSDDPVQQLCIHCHSPNYAHEAGTEDDRTPVGVHEGLSCNACHSPHSNNAMNSCVKCHPAISNCKLDVRQMDTTFANPDSRNNIHFVSCKDCHPERNQ